jgi:hypothetical protein
MGDDLAFPATEAPPQATWKGLHTFLALFLINKVKNKSISTQQSLSYLPSLSVFAAQSKHKHALGPTEKA